MLMTMLIIRAEATLTTMLVSAMAMMITIFRIVIATMLHMLLIKLYTLMLMAWLLMLKFDEILVWRAPHAHCRAHRGRTVASLPTHCTFLFKQLRHAFSGPLSPLLP